MSNVIGLDIGRSGVKAYAGTKQLTFPSIVGEANERKLVTDYGDQGYEVSFEGTRRFIGTLAQMESSRWRYMMVDEKATRDALTLALTALHQAGFQDYIVVTGLPVEQHVDENKRKFRDLLLGNRSGVWDVTVNGVRRVFRIEDVKIAVEGGAAFWSDPRDGLVRLIDAGSKTVNYITMQDRRYIYLKSGSLPFGFQTERRTRDGRKSVDIVEFADQVAGELGAVDWRSDDTVLVAGGRAKELSEALRTYFPKAEPLPNALFANAIGYYRAGKAVL